MYLLGWPIKPADTEIVVADNRTIVSGMPKNLCLVGNVREIFFFLIAAKT